MFYTSVDDLISDCAVKYILLLREKPVSCRLTDREASLTDIDYLESKIPGFFDKVCALVSVDLLER